MDNSLQYLKGTRICSSPLLSHNRHLRAVETVIIIQRLQASPHLLPSSLLLLLLSSVVSRATPSLSFCFDFCLSPPPPLISQMTSKLDQSLDSIISSERSAGGGRGGRGGRGGGQANGTGPVRRGRTRAVTAPYARVSR